MKFLLNNSNASSVTGVLGNAVLSVAVLVSPSYAVICLILSGLAEVAPNLIQASL